MSDLDDEPGDYCIACGGSGHDEAEPGMPCEACDGTGIEP